MRTNARCQRRVRVRRAAAGFLLIVLAAFGRPAPPDKPLSLTLQQCIETALGENLALSIDRLNPALDMFVLKEIREKFLPQFGLTYQNSDTNTPGTWGVEGSNIAVKSDSLSFGLTQSFAWGASVSLNVSSSMTNTTRSYTTINPSYFSSVHLNLTQPLLRGFGTKAVNAEAIKAGRIIRTAEASLRARAFQTVYDVEEAYWNLVRARENLKVQESSLASSREVLTRNREAVRLGTASGSEVLNAETEVARYEDAVLSAGRAVQRPEDHLRKLLNLPAGGRETIVLLDPPTIEIRKILPEDILRAALANRPEMDVCLRRVENCRSDVDFYRNQALPRLDLNLSFWNPGISGVKNIYQDDNPLTGIVIDRNVGGRRDSFTDILKGKYKNWSVDLRLELPLGSLLTQSGLARARAALDQHRLQLEKQKNDIEFEVRDIVRELEVKARIIASSARYRELTEKRAASETRRYRQGLVGSEWLFNYRRELDNARSAEIQAIVEYRIALACLDRITGIFPAAAWGRNPS